MYYYGWSDPIPPPPRPPWHIAAGSGDHHPRSACSPARCGEQPDDDPKARDLTPYSASWYVSDTE